MRVFVAGGTGVIGRGFIPLLATGLFGDDDAERAAAGARAGGRG